MGRYIFKLPDVGEGTTEATIAEWHAAVGDRIAEDQPLVDLETDKAIVEIPSPTTGTVVSIHGAVGDRIAVGSELVVIETESASEVPAPTSIPSVGKSLGGPQPDTDSSSRNKTEALSSEPARPRTPASELAAADRKNESPQREKLGEEEEASAPGGAPAKAPVEIGRLAEIGRVDQKRAKVRAAEGASSGHALASPAVRKRARDLQIDLRVVPGSGPGGRVMHADLDALRGSVAVSTLPVRSSTEASADDQIVEHRVAGIRRRIAERMQESKRRIPHFSYVEEVDVTALEDLRLHLNEMYGKRNPKLTPLPFVMRAIVRAVRQHAEVNARFDDENGIVRRYGAVHIGIATQTPNGLLVPVVTHVQIRNLWDCAAEASRLAALSREGRATRSQLTGSTITITSLGDLGGIVSTPVINYPEVAIVGLNRIAERPVVRNGAIVIRKIMNLSSSFDHRVVDGWNAASFIRKVKTFLEQPASLFIE